MIQDPKKIRNIAIIAHVDHGKTTLVDHLIKQAGTFRDNEHVEERLMDSMDLERERGITIAAKNASFMYKDIKVNIVDTPGHSDFGGEVERILNMVDGCILLCDASEGPLPQTRFVLKKALEGGKKVIVCINKIDRSDARIQEVHNELFDLFIDLDATEEQCDFHTVYAIAREGMATLDPAVNTGSLEVLYDAIVNLVPPPTIEENAPLQVMVSNISYNDYVGRLAIGRMRAGTIKVGDEVLCVQANAQKKVKVSALFQYKVNSQVPAQEVGAGDMVVIAGMEDFTIGDTITSVVDPRPLPRIRVEEPTVGMVFSVNNGPFAGLDGKNVTSRKIIDRLDRELLYNVAIRVEKTDSTDAFKVVGRGELQLGVLIEQMRRENFELLVSKPTVVFKEENGKKMEPMEIAVIDIEDAYVGAVTEKLGKRKGVMTNMVQKGSGRTRLEFRIPSRGLIGYRSEFLTDTRGTGLLNTQFDGWDDYRGEIEHRLNGAMISDRKGTATSYAIWNLQERGVMMVEHGDEVYEGMIVGEHAKENDLEVNITREKKLSNVRASGSDEAIRLVPVKKFTLERAMEWIKESELIEVTPKHIRLRLRELDPHKRAKAAKE
ncbi:translational GTPase TypA [Bdellovibrio bacteriovorus]|uniref:Large ribosomal subunit assembly factor BipA n=1 Tax=Bdellovibrio bacteriovorus (strain ATCC 15356 / DSM 50701 / NCIMB 9529 / HD100) TaxID=264462 RepID=Q6MRF0_BDEBA|nr:translational GTPase TypA [Bdellovibrio bacteriovorus]BEV66704.1 GTP-binding protein TypA/BipA [Bdellovibrio bacteriovorus]CAE77808.1 GTP-binding elongation factor:elongation factor Tu domain [Bdellovibrio bacteriovorus HD100]